MTIRRDIIIIGAGAAGIGFGIALEELGVNSYLILEKGLIGESFRRWPSSTRFITPSFTSNGFGMPDLNAISPDTSPAYTLGKERLSGKDYAHYLDIVADGYNLHIKENSPVSTVSKNGDKYFVATTTTTYECKYLIFAVGEFQFPKTEQISGADLAKHYGEITDWSEIKGDHATVIGGNESAMDAAINLSNLGKSVTIYTQKSGLDAEEADPSASLSPYTRQRLLKVIENKSKIKVVRNQRLKSIRYIEGNYQLTFNSIETIERLAPPILCTGFNNGLASLGTHLFEFDNKQTILSDCDESTLSKNCFQIGPHVRHQEVIFCFIYKFRQRFAVIIKEIASREGLVIHQENFQHYQNNAMYLEDCGSCEVNCSC